ncbi:MAG: alpha-mannosidase [Anaerolineae bacterium]|nr:alpha-mannosidase [Anaerolineae bacterium]
MTPYWAQYADIVQTFVHAPRRYEERLARIGAELRFAHQLCAAHPAQAPAWRARIVEAGHVVQAGLAGASVDVDALTAQAEALLAPVGEVAKQYTLRCVSHAHIDMNWMWSWPETVAVTNDTFQTMLALMDEFPGFLYSQSQASTYALIERYNPPLFEAIRQRVAEGRWEVTASQWVEGDKNMASGESISRHLLYTRAYFSEKFGLSPEDVQVDFEPDTFGHPATLPTILARGGVRYYYHCRGSHGPHLYWWVGPDGSRVLAFNDVQWYMTVGGPNQSLTPAIADALVEYALATGMKQMPVLYGVGDHGGGPTRADLRQIVAMDAWPVYPRVMFSTLHGFFRAAEAEATIVPEVRGERNFVFAGCYTSQARQKEANRHGENLLYAAEAAATLGSRVAGGAYPQAHLAEAWRTVLFSQFHDILPGSGTRDTRHYTLGQAQEAQAAAMMARTNALRAIAARVDTASLRRGWAAYGERAYKDEVASRRAMGAGVGNAAGMGGESAYSAGETSDRAFLIYNPLPYPREEVVQVKLWDTALDPTQLAVSGGGMDPRPVQVLDEGTYWGHTYGTLAFPVRAPALGYCTVCVSDRLAELGLTRDEVVDPWAGMGGSNRRIEPQRRTLENEALRVVLDPASGGVVSLLDKRTGREWARDGARIGTLQVCVEANEGMTAWRIGQFLTREDLYDGGRLSVVHDGPYVQTLRWTRQVRHSTLTLEVTLCAGMPRLDYRLRVDWREMGSREAGTPHLRVRFPLGVDAPRARYEIPFGSIARDLFEGQEVVAQRWVDLCEGEDGAGVTLANTSKYGFSVEGTTLAMTLLRASSDPDPLPDLGEHEICYALAPHGAGWTVGRAMQAGEALNQPLLVASCGIHEGDLPGAMSTLAIEAPNVHLAALKESEDGRGIALRLIEVEGRETEARVALAPALAGAGARAVAVDMLERPVGDASASLAGGALTVRLPAYGIVTVRVESGPLSG